jgi:hypothetical protein
MVSLPVLDPVGDHLLRIRGVADPRQLYERRAP